MLIRKQITKKNVHKWKLTLRVVFYGRRPFSSFPSYKKIIKINIRVE